MTEESTSLFLQRLVTLARWRRLIITNTLVVAAGAVIVSVLLPNWYRTTASVFPPEEEGVSLKNLSGMMTATALGAGRSNLPLLATPSDVYATILKSRSVQEEIIRRHDLMRKYKAKTMDDALIILKSRFRAKVGGEGVVSLTVIDKDPVEAAAIANDFIAQLDVVAREHRRTSAGAVRAFLETRVQACRDSLRLAERNLRDIQERTGILAPEDQTRALVESAVQIDLGRKMREVELGMLRAQVGPDDPERARLTREIDLYEQQLKDVESGGDGDTAAYRLPLTKLPAATVAYAHAMRQVKIQETLYGLLMEQLEQYRIQELRDTPTLSILDRAEPPTKKFRPMRSVICVISTLTAFLLSCALAFAMDGWAKMQRDDPERSRTLRAIAASLHPRRWFSPGHDLPAP